MPQMRLLVAVEPVDFRKGIDGLVAVCRQRLRHDSMSGAVFVFASRNRKSIKLLAYDGQGFWLFPKAAVAGRFTWWPKAGTAAAEQLEAHPTAALIMERRSHSREHRAAVATGRAGGSVQGVKTVSVYSTADLRSRLLPLCSGAWKLPCVSRPNDQLCGYCVYPGVESRRIRV